MDLSTLLVEIDDAGTAVVTINRPEKLNALNAQVVADLDACFAALADDPKVRGVILTGAGPKAFVAGADISQFTKLDALSARRFAQAGQAVFNRIERLQKPVVAAINGFALGGGCELALACHLRIAVTGARLGQPEVGLGIIPGYGGTQRLPRIVGMGLATELILTGRHITAERAYEIGLVNHVVSADELIAEARKLVGSITAQAPVAVALSLEALRASELPLASGLDHESALFGQACSTEDFHEGATAFLERRKPVFKGQ